MENNCVISGPPKIQTFTLIHMNTQSNLELKLSCQYDFPVKRQS